MSNVNEAFFFLTSVYFNKKFRKNKQLPLTLQGNRFKRKVYIITLGK